MAIVKKSLLAGLALALALSAAPSVANADEGDTKDETATVNDDPGIAALHKAVDTMRDARTAMRVECPDMHDAKCRAASAKVRAEFKVAQKAAIAEHHAFKQAEKKARDEAKQKSKDKPSSPPLG